ncbi:MAG: Gldg family protein [Nitrospiraceae bacterium]|nr:MAG: Gldg family protein [Nitrospiraceae bacterium]
MPAEKNMNSGRMTKFLIYCVVVVLLNIAGITLFFRADLTSNKVYSLSDASRKVVETLSEPLTVKVFFNANLPAPYNTIERYLHDLLDEYSVAGGKYFNYQFYNVTADDEGEAGRIQELAQNYGIHPVQIQAIEQDEVKFQMAYMGMAILHGDIIESIPTITSTEGLEYQITSTIQKMNNKISALLRLKDKITVKLFLSSSLRVVAPYMNILGISEIPKKMEDIVETLNDKNYGKLTFVNLDPSTDPEAEDEAGKFNLLHLNWDSFQDRQGRQIKADRGLAGIVVEHEDRFEKIKLIEVFSLPLFGTQYQLTDPDELEQAIAGTIDAVVNIHEEIGYLADHGTLAIGPDMQMFGMQQQQETLSNLNKLLESGYSVKPLNLQKDGIPEGLSFLMIAGPKEPFTDYELYQIDQYLMKGKNIAVFMDAFHEIRPQQQGMMRQMQRPVYMPVKTGLEKLLGHYGLNMKESIVLDEHCFKQKVPNAFGGGERAIYFAPIIKNERINKEADFLENIKGLVMLQASPVDIDEQTIKDNGLTALELFSSSERSWQMQDRIDLNPMYLSPPSNEDDFKSVTMAYILEGAFPSYFADKPVPAREEEKDESPEDEKAEEKKDSGMDMSKIVTEGVTIKKGKPGRIFLIGTSEILKDNVIDNEGQTPNAQFVMNVIDYLNGRGDIAVMRSKTQRFNPLREVAPAVRTGIKAANIVGLPVLVVIAGMIVWARRRTRKRMIQRIFGT